MGLCESKSTQEIITQYENIEFLKQIDVSHPLSHDELRVVLQKYELFYKVIHELQNEYEHLDGYPKLRKALYHVIKDYYSLHNLPTDKRAMSIWVYNSLTKLLPTVGLFQPDYDEIEKETKTVIDKYQDSQLVKSIIKQNRQDRIRTVRNTIMNLA
jgi:hypothetical protein